MIRGHAIRTLANGEVWFEFRGHWHMPFELDYAPVAAEYFSDYARSIAAGWYRTGIEALRVRVRALRGEPTYFGWTGA
jgi:hypothetical protein